MEGGGERKAGKAALRQGMNDFLGEAKAAIEALGWRWQLTACGGRNQAYRGFRRALEQRGGEDIAMLLVDAEGPVAGGSVDHLGNRDRWTFGPVDEEVVHLITRSS